MARSLDHAKHNEKVCRYLKKKPDFSDWIITITFYTALHYVGHKLLLTHKIKNLKDHKKRTEAVEKNLPEISGEYSHLLDMSQNARYRNYIKDREAASVAEKHLEKIKVFCLK